MQIQHHVSTSGIFFDVGLLADFDRVVVGADGKPRESVIVVGAAGRPSESVIVVGAEGRLRSGDSEIVVGAEGRSGRGVRSMDRGAFAAKVFKAAILASTFAMKSEFAGSGAAGEGLDGTEDAFDECSGLVGSAEIEPLDFAISSFETCSSPSEDA